MNAQRLPKPGERWLFRRWVIAGVAHRGGAARVEHVTDGPDARSTRVHLRLEASGATLDTSLPAFLHEYEFDSDPEPVEPDVVGPGDGRRLRAVGE